MKNRPLCVIDVGSNSIRSLIVEPLPDGGYRILDDEKDTARLAAGLDSNGRISAEAADRAIKALQRMSEIARARGVQQVSAVATSAIRNAGNRASFVRRVRRATGLRLRVVSGKEEAQLAFDSAALSFELGDRPCAVADIGGGSTELILAFGSHIQRVYSLHLGTVALTEAFLDSDPVLKKHYRKMRSEVRRQLEEAHIATEPAPQFLIASGGTASAIAQISMALQGLQGRPVQGFEMTQAAVLHILQGLLHRSLAERRKITGLSPQRAEIIIAGVALLYEIMSHLKVNTLKVSGRGIRHALIDRMTSRRLGPASKRPTRPHRVAAAISFARSLNFERKHGEQVREIALSLFDQLSEPLDLDPDTRDLLAAAALLHDVGYVVGFRQHHKHAYHLISHAQLEGFTPNERELIALVARYHRRAQPRRKHRAWAQLSSDDRDHVRRLSALLRIADALDRRHSGELGTVTCTVADGQVHFLLEGPRDLGVEAHAAEEKADLFRDISGLGVTFETKRTKAQTPRKRPPRPSAKSS